MPLAHTCPHCDVFLHDLLENALPHDYPEKQSIREQSRKRLVPLLAKSIKKLVADYPVSEMQKIWNSIMFEARISGKINYRVVSDMLKDTLAEKHLAWSSELEYLESIAVDDGLIRMKGLTEGRMMVLAEEWIAYCVYLVWTNMPSYHYKHNFPNDQEAPEVFQFRLSSKIYDGDLYD